MTELKNSIVILLAVFSFSSCMQEEIPVDRHLSGDSILGEADISFDYRYQVFYSLEENMVVSQNLKTDWDLGFECSPDGWHVILNNAKAMSVKKMDQTTYEDVLDDESVLWKWDAESGNIDSTAIGNWLLDDAAYIVDRGYDYNGQLIGLKKLKIENYSEESFSIRFGNLDGSETRVYTVAKNADLNFVSILLEGEGSVAEVEPPKDTWDLMFTQYLKFYDDSSLPDSYLVTGVLLNRHQTIAYEDTGVGYSDFKFENILTNDFSTNINTIGHDWKTYDFDTGFYITNSERNYIIQNSKAYYFKLHFLDFYNEFGEKGMTTFEMQRL